MEVEDDVNTKDVASLHLAIPIFAQNTAVESIANIQKAVLHKGDLTFV